MVPGAIAYYPCDEGAGQILYDHSGNGNHGTLGSTSGVDTNDPAWSTQGLVFGGDDFANLGILPITGQFTAGVIVRVSEDGHGVLLGNPSATWLNGFWIRQIRIASGDKIAFGIARNTPWIYTECNLSSTPRDGLWHHYTGVFDGAKLYGYVDGLPVVTIVGPETPSISSSAAGYLGKNNVDNLYSTYAGAGAYLYPFAASPTQVIQQHTYEKARLALKGVILP